MRVHILSPYPERIEPIIKGAGDELTTLDLADFVVVYGHREILREPVLSWFPHRIVNLHISLLPWNRGADPNFWSWFDDTPKGVSLHFVDEGIDTGPVIAQREYHFWTSPTDTLATTYHRLQGHAIALFAQMWPVVRTGKAIAVRQRGAFTYHRSADKKPFFAKLPKGWGTPVRDVEAMGHRWRSQCQSGSRPPLPNPAALMSRPGTTG